MCVRTSVLCSMIKQGSSARRTVRDSFAAWLSGNRVASSEKCATRATLSLAGWKAWTTCCSPWLLSSPVGRRWASSREGSVGWRTRRVTGLSRRSFRRSGARGETLRVYGNGNSLPRWIGSGDSPSPGTDLHQPHFNNIKFFLNLFSIILPFLSHLISIT